MRVRKDNECQHTVGVLGIGDDVTNHGLYEWFVSMAQLSSG